LKSTHLATLAIVSTLFSTILHADQPDTRHGAIEDKPVYYALEGGMTLTWQHASRRYMDDEFSGSVDLVATFPLHKGTITLYLEGSTTPEGNGVGSWLPEANADLGTALDDGGKGRIQVSALHYNVDTGNSVLTLGLLDATGFLDRSSVANDETQQFLGTSFVNNPTIEFPDYHLAAAWHYQASPERPGFTVLAGSSHGLGDNEGNYGRLSELDARNKGLFAALELYGYASGTLWRLGAWHNGASHPELDGRGNHRNWGVYTSLDLESTDLKWNLRSGWANPLVSQAKGFLSLAAEQQLANWHCGAAVSYTRASEKTDASDIVHAEVYARHEVFPGLEASLDLQWIRNSGFRRSLGDSWVAGIRTTWLF
jgi:hypothetical protein